jgi:hypothetical protein
MRKAMKAALMDRYGSNDVVEVVDINLQAFSDCGAVVARCTRRRLLGDLANAASARTLIFDKAADGCVGW